MKPILFQWGRLAIYSYGAMVAAAFLVGTLLLWRRARREGAPGDWVLDLAILSILAAIIGARVAFVFLNLPYYLAEPWQIFNLREGGLTLYGGLAGAVLAGFWYLKRRGISPWCVADWLAPVLAVGIAIGRVGCLLNGCCYGRLTGKDWGLPVALVDREPRYPTQLFEAGGALLLALVLFWLDHRMARQPVRQEGDLFLIFLGGYGLLRFFVEVWRDTPRWWLGLSLGQWSSLILVIVVGMTLSYHFLNRGRFSNKTQQEDA